MSIPTELKRYDDHCYSGRGHIVDDGKRVGVWQYVYTNGTVESVGTYIDDKKEGKWYGFHDNGRISWSGTFCNGEMHGEWVMWTSNGDLLNKIEYNHGEEVRVREWVGGELVFDEVTVLTCKIKYFILHGTHYQIRTT